MFTFLGVVIDDKLCWDDHVDKVRREIAPYVFILYKIRPFVSEKTCWLIYYAYIASRLMYIAPAWRTATKTQTEHVGGSTAIGPEDNQEKAQTDVVCLTAQRECAQRQHAVGLQIAYVPAQGHQQ